MTTDLTNRAVLLADDDPALLQRCRPHLEEAGLHVTTCSSGEELQRMLATRAADFAAVMTDLWDMGTPEARFVPERDLPRLVQAYPDLPFIVFSAEGYQAQQYEDAGVCGYVLKTDGVEALKKALRLALDTEQPRDVKMYYSPSVEFRYRISRRERNILQDAAAGLSHKQSADHLKLAPSAVATYRTRLINKFRQDDEEPMNITRVVAIALREGLIR